MFFLFSDQNCYFCEGKADKYWIRFVMQPLQNPPLCGSTVDSARMAYTVPSVREEKGLVC